MSFLYKLHMKVIGSISISYGTEQSKVQQIPPLNDEVYPHLHSAVTPGPDRRGPQAQCTGEMLCVTAPHMLAY